MIGKKLKHLLNTTGHKQIDLAKHLGISPSRLSNYLSDKREPDFDMLTEMAYFLGVDLNYFAERDFCKKRKDEIFEVAEEGFFYGSERDSVVKIPFAAVNGKKKSVHASTIPLSGVFLIGTKNPEENVTVFEVNSDIPSDIAKEGDYIICAKCSSTPLRDGDMLFENGRLMKFYRFFRDKEFVILINIENEKEHLRITSMSELEGFFKICWIINKK